MSASERDMERARAWMQSWALDYWAAEKIAHHDKIEPSLATLLATVRREARRAGMNEAADICEDMADNSPGFIAEAIRSKLSGDNQ